MPYDDLRRLIESNPDFSDFVGPMPESKVSAAEMRLGVTFPDDYRRFLTDYGCGNFGSEEFFGIIEGEPSCIPSVIFAVEDARRNGVPDDLILVWDAGIGEQYMIDLGQVNDGVAPIIKWIPGLALAGQSRAPVYCGFTAFFLSISEGQ